MLSKKFFAQMMSFACLLSLPAMAQAVRGQVRGLVTDQSGSVLPGAKVTLLNINTGVSLPKQQRNLHQMSSFAEVLTDKSTNLNRKDLTRENSANV
jgi:hypothetical protein